MTRALSTTGYAVLGMLALRPATSYELTQQMQRSLDYCWTTSERSLYDQPERLVALGLASVTTDDRATGARRTYDITPAGRAALREWMATDAGPPRFQNEPLVRVLFADQGSVEDLHRVLVALRAHIAERRRLGIAQLTSYLEEDGLFQERTHIVALVGDLISRILGVLDDWADEVLEITDNWDDTSSIGLSDDIRAVLERVVSTELQRTRHDAGSG